MSRRSLAPLLALLVLLAVGVVVLLRSLATNEVQLVDSTQATERSESPDSSTPAPAPDLTAAANSEPEPGDDDASIETTAPSASRENVDAASSDAELKDAIWISGRVILPDGTPLDERVEVLAEGRKFESRPLHQVTIGPDGTFRVAFSKKTKKAHLELRARYLYLDEDPAVAIDEPSKEVVLEPRLGGCIRGRLLLPANALDRAASLVGTTVSAHGSSASGRFRRTNSVEREAEADAALAFELGGLAPSLSYWVNAHPEDMVSVQRNGVRVEAGRVLDLDLELQVGATAAGRVVDEKGAPVEGAQISLRVEHSSANWSSSGLAKTGADGAFSLRGIQPGKVTLEAGKQGLASAEAGLGKLADAEVKSGIELVLTRGLSVSGRVQWPDAKPAAECKILYEFRPKSEEIMHFHRPENDQMEAAADGSFVITGLREGTLEITARSKREPTESGPDRGPLWVARVEGVKVGESGSGELVLVLASPKDVRGRALDDLGRPLERFQVKAEPVDGSQPWERKKRVVSRSFKSEAGEFALDGLHDGEWDVTADAEGYAESSAHRVSLPGDDSALDLVLPRAASVAGIVVDPLGKPVARAHVSPKAPRQTMVFNSGEDREETTTDAEGRFVLDDVAPGPVEVTAGADGYAESQALALELQPGEAIVDQVLTLRRGGRLTGEVLDASGRPDAGRDLHVYSTRGGEFRNLTADSAGRFEADGLSPGQYWIQTQPSAAESEAAESDDAEVEAAAWASNMKRATVEIVDGETAHVVLGGTARDAVKIHGKITSGGSPVSGCMVWAHRRDAADPAGASGASDASGKYEVTVASPGEYSLSVFHQKRGASYSEQVKVPGQGSFAHDVELPAGRVAGRVVGPDGEPAAEVSVQLAPESSETVLSGAASYGQTQSDEKGAFSFTGLRAGTYRLEAGSQPWEGRGSKFARHVRSGIVLEEGGSVDGLEVRLQAGCRVEGIVVGPGGEPVAGATVHARDAQGNLMQIWSGAQTDASGRFSMDGFAPGSATFVARTKTLASPETSPVTTRAGETARVEISLRGGTVLKVVTEDADGAAVRATPTIADERGRDVTWIYANMEEMFFEGGGTQGEWRYGPLPPGKYTVTAKNHDGASAKQEVRVSGQEEMVVTLRLGG